MYPREGVAARDGVTSEHNCSSKSRLVGAGGRSTRRRYIGAQLLIEAYIKIFNMTGMGSPYIIYD